MRPSSGSRLSRALAKTYCHAQLVSCCGDRLRKVCRPDPGGEVFAMLTPPTAKVVAQRLNRAHRQRHHAILVALPSPDQHHAPLEIDLLGPYPQGLHQAQPAAILQQRDQSRRAFDRRKEPHDLIPREDHRQAHRALGAHRVDRPIRQRPPEHLPVEEDQCLQRLVLGRCRDPATHGKIGEERGDFTGTELQRVLASMEDHEPSRPSDRDGHRPPGEAPDQACPFDCVAKIGQGDCIRRAH